MQQRERRGKSLTDDGDLILGSLELPESDIDGDTTLTLSLELVKNPGVLERTLSELSSLLLELLDGTLVNTTTLVDHVTSGGRLAGIDVADNDDVDVATLFFTVGLSQSQLFCQVKNGHIPHDDGWNFL